jgi:hypothetical protein
MGGMSAHPANGASIRRSSISLQEAVEHAPTLARLSQLATLSASRLAAIRPLLPPALRNAVKPGAPDADSWSVLVPHASAAAKLRQLMPLLLLTLESKGLGVKEIRIKVERPGS